MSDLLLVLAVAAITFATRIAFLIRPRPVPGGPLGRFLEVFPLALFLVIAASGLLAPEGVPAVTPALAGAAGGVVGGDLPSAWRRAASWIASALARSSSSSLACWIFARRL